MAARKTTTKTTEVPGSADPTTPLDIAAFLKASAPVLAKLKEDLHTRSEASPAVRQALAARHETERKRERTGDSFAEWRANFIDQVAAAWLLSCVFVRTLEDRGMLGHARLAGPGAQDSQTLFFELAPSLTERDYLLMVFRELSRFPATAALFDGDHNPVWMLAPSAEAAKALLQLFRAPSADAPAHRFGQSSTRFLGDLYQDLDEGVRQRFALLQTPDFVEAYILDKTLEPAIQRFGLDEATLIDPTCGSGHFLLGAFARLYEHRRRLEPDASERVVVEKALAAVAGADINPYAVAIARLRLTLAALEKAGYAKLANAPALPIRLAIADSLLYNPHLAQQQLGMVAGAGAEFLTYLLEDPETAHQVLHQQYAAVVGNPPYITCKDATLREKYRAAYPTASGKYALSVPFTERFFQLGRSGASIGMITANSFMKREFGVKLIEDFLPKWNLTRVENMSGAYIPGHGTPTVILFGTAEPPQRKSVHGILAKRGEPSTPIDASRGFVWRSVVEHGDDLGFENEFISVAAIARDTLAKHPWSLGGGGATDLKELLETRATATLSDIAESIGISCVTGEDAVYVLPPGTAGRQRIGHTASLVTGEFVRDWTLAGAGECVFPFDDEFRLLKPTEAINELRYLWPFRSILNRRKRFGVPMLERGLSWYELQELYAKKLRSPLSITFAFVATHNHFVLDRGGKVFKQSAPIIKLTAATTEEGHLALVAYLNSSTACFWMKQVSNSKGSGGIGGGYHTETWSHRMEFDSTKLAKIPLFLGATRELAATARTAEALCSQEAAVMPAAILRNREPSATSKLTIDELFASARATRRVVREKLVGLNEELDWLVYSLAGLTDAATDGLPPAPPVALGQRAFEIRWARELSTSSCPPTDWFSRHGGQLTVNIEAVPALQRPHIESRLRLLESVSELDLIEQPDFKRRWSKVDFEAEERVATGEWIADAVEYCLRKTNAPLKTTLLQKHCGEWTAECQNVLRSHSVPYFSAHCFSDAGVEKHAAWEAIWDLQRREDDGEKTGGIPAPPKYDQKDYRDPTYWRLRGKLDVPTERFISYPNCESDEDGEAVYGWAGWDHLQRAQALAALYNDRRDREGWAKPRLLPMLAGLLELVPWIKQWHNESNADYDGLRLGDYFEGFLEAQMREHGVTTNDLRMIRPANEKRSATAKTKQKAPAMDDT